MNQIVTELVIDGRGAEAGSAAYVRAMQVAQAAVDRLRDRENALKAASDANSASMISSSTSIQRAASAYDRLKASIDPVFAAAKGLERDLVTLDRAVTRLGVSEQEAGRMLDLITLKHDAAAQAAKRQADAYQQAAAAGREAAAADRFQGLINQASGVRDPALFAESAQASASVFATELDRLDDIGRLRAMQIGRNFTADLEGSLVAGAAKSARAAAAVFSTELDKLDEIARLKAQQAGQYFTEDLNARIGIGRPVNSARESAGVFAATGAGGPRLSSGQWQNLGYQANDVITMALLGAPVSQIAFSQGGQVLQGLQMGEGGISGSLKAIRSGAAEAATSIAAFLGPLGMIAAGFGVAATAAGAYYLLTREKAKSESDLLKDEAEAIRDLGDAYGDAAAAAKKFPTTSTANAFGISSANTISGLQIALKRDVGEMKSEVGRFITPGRSAGGYFDVAAEFKPFVEAIDYLQKTAAKGTPDILGFRKMVEDRWALDPNNEALTKAAAKLDDMTANSVKAARAIRQLKAVEDQIVNAKNAGPGGLSLIIDPHAGDISRAKAVSDQEARLAQMQRGLDASIQSINARTVSERAAAASASVMAEPVTRDYTKEERDFDARAASQKVFAQATREANDALRDTGDALKTAGLTGYAQQLAQINVEINKQIELNPKNAAIWRKVGEARKEALDIQTQKSLFQGQQDTLSQLQAEAAAVGATNTQYSDLMTTLKAKIDLEHQGISATSAAGQAYIENARKLNAFTEAVSRQKSAWDSVHDAESSVIDDLTSGLSGNWSDALKSAENDLLKTFTQLGISDPIKNAPAGGVTTLRSLFA